MINVEEVCKHIQSYIGIYEFVQQDEKTIPEVKAYLMEECGKPESTARAHIEAVKKSDTGLLEFRKDKISLNLEKAMEFERALTDIFHWDEYDFRSGELYKCKKELDKAKKTIIEANKRLKELDDINIEEMMSHREEINNYELKEDRARLENQALERELIEARMGQSVVDSASVRLKGSWDSYGEKLFKMKDVYPYLDLDTYSLSSYFHQLGKENKLTAAKLKMVSVGRVFSDRVLGKVVEHIRPFRKLRNCIWPNRDVLTTEELLAYDGLTNSEKLALYAFFSKRYSKEKQEILEQAAKNGINAEFVIRILETYIVSKKTKNAFLEALKLAGSDSEYQFRMKFARELIMKQWSIEAQYNGKMTSFQLVPVQEMEKIKRDFKRLELYVQYKLDSSFGPVDQRSEE